MPDGTKKTMIAISTLHARHFFLGKIPLTLHEADELKNLVARASIVHYGEFLSATDLWKVVYTGC